MRRNLCDKSSIFGKTSSCTRQVRKQVDSLILEVQVLIHNKVSDIHWPGNQLIYQLIDSRNGGLGLVEEHRV